MADPLSITASVIAIIGAAEGVTKIFEKLRNIENAPSELLALFNEVADLTLVLRSVQNFIRSQNAHGPQISQDQLQHLSELVDKAKNKVLQLEEFMEYRLVKPDSTSKNIKVARQEWMKAKRTIKEFKQNLRDIRQNITTHMIVINSWVLF